MDSDYTKDDFYRKKAKEEKYPARSIYKLKEIDGKYKLIKQGDFVLDLGYAPGSWLMYLSKKVGKRGRISGIDADDIKIKIPQNAIFLKEDIMGFIPSEVEGDKFNAVVSDLAPNTSGIDSADTEKSLELCERALEIAKNVLKDNGNFLCKIFEGEGINDFFNKVKENFKFTKRFRPQATRKQSREIYIIGKEFKEMCVKI